jgi:salicylate hydroxylase
LRLLLETLDLASASFLRTHFNKKLLSYEQDQGTVTLHFADGSCDQADILIGADGLGSPTRKKMYKDISERILEPNTVQALLDASRPSWTGTWAYRTLLDSVKLKEVAPDSIALKSGLVVRPSK